jgi:alkylation response protein AidB-like acyl-CoA dehydrogenase
MKRLPFRFHSSLAFRNRSFGTQPTLYVLTEEEAAIKESVAKFAQTIVSPRVKAMDENEVIDKDILQALFDQGLMGLDVASDYGGSGGISLTILTLHSFLHVSCFGSGGDEQDRSCRSHDI